MKVRELRITNFRGIADFRWQIPEGKKIVCIIGPGDAGKTTIIEAMSWLLSDKWYVPVTVTDFHSENAPIVIEGFLGDLPKKLRTIEGWGLSLCSLGPDGNAHEPEDGEEPLAHLRLTIAWDTLEPLWEVVKSDGETVQAARPSDRRKLGCAMLGQLVDAELRWGSSSSLGVVTKEAGGVGSVLRDALTAESAALRGATLGPELQSALSNVKGNAERLGAGRFEDLRPGLDYSRSRNGGLALYSGDTPLSGFGLGTRRLVALSIEKTAAQGKSTFFIDEVETGLEPHRLIGLIETFRRDDRVSQVFMTTHSPSAVENCDASELATVIPNGENPYVVFVPDKLQPLHRSNPSAFLARKIVMTEGSTEEGLVRAIVRHYDDLARREDKPSSASYGVAICNGGGGAPACEKALAFSSLGYDVFVMLDSDDSTIDGHVADLGRIGAHVHRWDHGADVEHAVLSRLTKEEFIQLMADTISQGIMEESMVISSLRKAGVECGDALKLELGTWEEFDESSLRETIADACTTKLTKRCKGWYKSTAGGDFLARWLLGDLDSSSTVGAAARYMAEDLLEFVYPGVDWFQDE